MMSADAIGLVPLPQHYQVREGRFVLSSASTLWDGASTGAGRYLRQQIQSLCGLALANGDEGASIRLLMEPEAFGAEAYALEVNPDAVVLRAGDEAGLFYGIQTLLQLADTAVFDPAVQRQTWDFACAQIDDAPRFAYRGLLIDIARHFFDAEFLKKQIDGMARHKLNVLHLHLTDDTGWRMESGAYPKLTEGQSHLSAAEIADLVAYAAERHIVIMPEVDMPGHGGAAARAYPEFYDGHITLNPGNPESFDFAKTLLTETAALFPSQYIHFGGDEVRQIQWEGRADVEVFKAENNLADDFAIEGEIDRRLAGMIEGLGRTPMAWDEAAVHAMPASTVIMWWKSERPDRRDKALSLGHRMVLSPNEYYYFDYSQFPGEPGAPWEGNVNGPMTLEAVYRHDPVPDGVVADDQILGLQAAIWTEFIRTVGYFEFMLYPRLCAFAETAWSAPQGRSFEGFEQRLAVHDQRLAGLGVNARRIGENAIGNNVPYLTH